MSRGYARLGLAILVALGASGCQSPNVPVYGERTEENPAAEIRGVLTVQDGCLVLVTPATAYLVTWPPGTRWNDVTDTVELDGRHARLGASVTLGGGELAAGPIDESDWETAPTEECLAIGLIWRAHIILDPASQG